MVLKTSQILPKSCVVTFILFLKALKASKPGIIDLKVWPEISKKKLIRQQQQQTSDCWRQLISMRWHSMLSEFLNLDHPRHSTYYIEYLLKLSSVQQLIFVDLHMQKSAALHISFSIKA